MSNGEQFKITPKKPIQGKLLNTEDFIRKNNIKEVTSHAIFEPNTNKFHPEGLFSEEIFGSVLSEERFLKFGYIDLHAEILQPFIYNNLKQIKGYYLDILEGKKYAIFNEKTKDFELVDMNEPKAKTGFQFFINHVYQLKPQKSTSPTKQGYIDMFLKYQKEGLLTTSKLLVLPAGMRDIKQDAKALAKDDINNKYLAALSLAQSISKDMSNNSIYDVIKVSLQKKINEIYEYIYNIVSGDKGFVQDKYGDRNIVFSARNVCSADYKTAMSPNDPTNLKPTEVKLSLLQAAKIFELVLLYHMKRYFEAYIDKGNNYVSVVDMKTLKPVYKPVKSKEKNKFLEEYKLENFINSLKYDFFKNSNVEITDIENKKHPFIVCYQYKRRMFWFNDIDTIKPQLDELGIKIDNDFRKNVRSITWAEFIYKLLKDYVEGQKFCFVTRYPAIQDESIRPFKVKVATTIPSQKVKIILGSTSHPIIDEYYEYPIIGNKYVETNTLNQLTLKGYGADFDGDMTSTNSIISEEGNQELEKYINDFHFILTDDMKFTLVENTTSELVIRNMTMEK